MFHRNPHQVLDEIPQQLGGLCSIQWSHQRVAKTKYPFTTNDIVSKVRRKKHPGLIFEQGIKFKVHSSTPIQVLHSWGVTRWFNERNGTSTIGKESTWERIPNSTIDELLGFGNMVLGQGNHGMRRGFSYWQLNLSGRDDLGRG